MTQENATQLQTDGGLTVVPPEGGPSIKPIKRQLAKPKKPTLTELVGGMAESMKELQSVVVGIAEDQQEMKKEINANKGGTDVTTVFPLAGGISTAIPEHELENPAKPITPETDSSARSKLPFHQPDPLKSKPSPKTDPLKPDEGLVEVNPVLPDYVTLKNEILGEEFGILMNQFTDRPNMQVVIIVPDKYSNTPPEQRSCIQYDIRSKVVGLATGVNDIRQWFGLISQNLVQSTHDAMPVVSAQNKLEKQGQGGPGQVTAMQPPTMPT